MCYMMGILIFRSVSGQEEQAWNQPISLAEDTGARRDLADILGLKGHVLTLPLPGRRL